MDSRNFQPVLGRIFCVESEFEVKTSGFWRPGANKLGKTTLEKKSKIIISCFPFLFFVFNSFIGLNMLVSNLLALLRSSEVLEGIDRSGRLQEILEISKIS